LKRRKTGNALATFMQMGLRKDAKLDDSKIPGQMRGVIGNMKRAAADAEDSGSGEGY